jgi:hypothetical protein
MELTNTILRVKQSPIIGLKPFQKAFEKLPGNEKRPVKLTLMQELGWAVSTFDYKKRGDTPIRENEIPVIEAIFQGFGINAWTGERI